MAVAVAFATEWAAAFAGSPFLTLIIASEKTLAMAVSDTANAWKQNPLSIR